MPDSQKKYDWLRGFTVAELLISLSILGVMAAFVIPKLLDVSQTDLYNQRTKDALAAVAGAYSAYKAAHGGSIPGNFNGSMIMPYLNYVGQQNGGSIDWSPGLGTLPCAPTSGADPCLKLHSGGILTISTRGFGGTNPNNVLVYWFDPDGLPSTNPTDYSGTSTMILLYYNGFVTTAGGMLPNSCDSSICPMNTANTFIDPPYIRW